MLINNDSIEIRKESWMEVVMNKEDGFVNGSLLADQIGKNLNQFLGLKDTKENIEHIQFLTGNKEKYEVVNSWENVKGNYIHPLLALDFVAMKKKEDKDYQEYYEFLKEVIFDWMKKTKNTDIIIEGFHGVHADSTQ